MNTVLWIVAGVLAAAYVLGGAAKMILSKPAIAGFGPAAKWVEGFSATTVKLIGALEVLGGLGLILPAVLGIAPVLVPLAAAGLATIMVGATITRLRRREYKYAALDVVYLLLALFVAWGRLGPEPFTG